MKNHKTLLIATAVCALTFCIPFEASAQLEQMFAAQRKMRNTDKPTRISAQTMDVDIQQNTATLLGSVEVDDPELNIKCRKMVIYLTDVPEKDGKKFKEAKDSKKLDRIECYGDVVITRSTDNASLENRQQAFANKAVYSMSTSTITLQENPVVLYGVNKLVGEEIQIDTRTERVRITKGVYTGKGSFAAGLDK